jgi:hypothetical protein
VMLDTLPLSMQVPQGWQITRHGTAGSIVWLEGPTPHSDARIDLKQREPLSTSEYELYLRGTEREQREEPAAQVRIRDAGPMKVVERISMLKPVTAPLVDAQGLHQLDEHGEFVVQTTTPMRWRLNVFVPREQEVEHYELNFVVITREQYEVDRPLLESMLGTLRYIGPGTAPATQPAPAAPSPDAGPS